MHAIRSHADPGGRCETAVHILSCSYCGGRGVRCLQSRKESWGICIPGELCRARACVKGNLSWTLRATLHPWLFLDSVGSVRVRTGQRRVGADSPLSCLIQRCHLLASHVRFAQVLPQTKFHALNDFCRKSPQRVATEATASLFCYYVRRKRFYRYVHLVDDFTVQLPFRLIAD